MKDLNLFEAIRALKRFFCLQKNDTEGNGNRRQGTKIEQYR